MAATADEVLRYALVVDDGQFTGKMNAAADTTEKSSQRQTKANEKAAADAEKAAARKAEAEERAASRIAEAAEKARIRKEEAESKAAIRVEAEAAKAAITAEREASRASAAAEAAAARKAEAEERGSAKAQAAAERAAAAAQRAADKAAAAAENAATRKSAAAERAAAAEVAAAEKAANREAAAAAKAADEVERQRLREIRDAELAADREAAAAAKAANRTGAATRNLGRQISDIGVGLAGGQSPFLIIAQQAPQVADALADTGGRAAKVAAFFAGPWGAALLAAGSILGVFVGKLLESGDAASTAEKHLKDFANAQVDLGKYIDQTTGKLIAQNRVLAQTTANRIPAQLVAKNIEVQGTVNQAFAAARDVGGYSLSRGRVSGNRAVYDATAAAGGNVQALFRNISAAAKANPGDKELQSLVVTIGDLAGKAQQGAEGIRDLQNQGAKLTTALNGGTVATTATVAALVKQEAATTGVEKARARLSAVEAKAAAIDALDEGPAKTKALADYHAELLSATKAVDAAQLAQKAHNKELSAAAVEAKKQAKIWEQVEITARNVSTTLTGLSKKMDLSALGLTDFLPKKDPELSFDQVISGARSRTSDSQDARIEAGMQVVDKLYQAQQDNIRSLADLYESAFTGGSKSIGETLKRELLSAVAIGLAKFTLTGKFDLGSTGGLLGSITSLFGKTTPAATPGRASGGPVAAGQLYRVNEASAVGKPEFFRPNGGGEIIPLGQTRAAMGGGTTIVQHFTLDARGGITTTELLGQVNSTMQAIGQAAMLGGSADARSQLARSAKYRLG